MAKTSVKEQLAASKNDLVERLYGTLPDANADSEAWGDAFLDAEILIDTYIEAVESQTTELPDPQGLALACIHLLFTTRTLTEEDLKALTRLNAPALGASLYELAPVIFEMKRRALAGLEAMARTEAEAEARKKRALSPLSDDEIPF
ncbi:hypothetical protein DelCs14_2696 [Delftia sp. Cs1-4]|uniref:hypothetical protein n=1 Tax=Delftia sp. (strain Cs1-4) TaxID=742013 RepID=UPI00020E82F4|nr:hypothetical protein [Delftia sp. Cs1-4]AEF89708.1 hypothetical protein DelCs14_2696 [Delftia sp. Cs1-4]